MPTLSPCSRRAVTTWSQIREGRAVPQMKIIMINMIARLYLKSALSTLTVAFLSFPDAANSFSQQEVSLLYLHSNRLVKRLLSHVQDWRVWWPVNVNSLNTACRVRHTVKFNETMNYVLNLAPVSGLLDRIKTSPNQQLIWNETFRWCFSLPTGLLASPQVETIIDGAPCQGQRKSILCSTDLQHPDVWLTQMGWQSI